MLKATLRSAALLGLLGATVPAFAEVQNVRVGGDITARAFWRSNLDLHNDNTAGATLDQEDNFFMSTIGVNIGADLTENVSTFVRMANERDWNIDAAGGATGDMDLSQGYITLKELFYSPLTLRVGRQPIVWGRGLVLGSSLIPNTILRGGDTNAAIAADEFTDFTSFDAVRATLDLTGSAQIDVPLTLDYVYIKLDENTIGIADDINLQGINLSSQMDKGEAELYYLNKRDKSGTAPNTGAAGSVNTIGTRGSMNLGESSLVWAEAAYQFGRTATDPNLNIRMGESHQAWAFNLGIQTSLTDVEWTPMVGAEFIYYSGKDTDGARSGWDPIARGYYTTVLRDFQAVGFYPPDQTCYVETTNGAGGPAGEACTGAASNQYQLSLFTSYSPLEDLTVDHRFSWFWLPVGAIPDGGAAGTQVGKREKFVGTEWDTIVNYDYTDDVELGLIYAVFWPGGVYHSPNNHTAQELISSVSVKF